MSRLAVTSTLLLSFLAIAFMTGCAAAPTPRPIRRFRLEGSDSMLWLARTVTNAYTQERPDITFAIQVSNSEAGLRSTNTYSQTIGMVSRKIKPSELEQSRATVVARDGIAIIANPNNPINAIQSSQILQVFSGDILTWPTGPLFGKSIVVVSREEGSGTRRAFEEMVMNGQRVTLTAVVMPGEASVVDYVAQHPDAIGYVSMGAVTPQVRAMTVDDIPLSPQTVSSQQYPYVRTLTFLVPYEPDPEMQAFVDFVLSSEGQTLISQRFGRAP